MPWFKNLKVRKKMLLAFTAVILLAAGAGVFIISSMKSVENSYAEAMRLTGFRVQHIFAAKDHFAKAQVMLHEAYYPENTRDDLIRISANLEKELDAVCEELNSLSGIASVAVQEKAQAILAQMDAYRSDAKEAVDILLSVNIISFDSPIYRDALIQAEEKTISMGAAYADDMTDAISGLSVMAVNTLHDLADKNTANATRILQASIGLFAAVALCSISIALYMSAFISKPLVPLSAFMTQAGLTGDIAQKPADAEIIGKYAQAGDEIGQALSGSASFTKHVSHIAGALLSVAKGDLTVEVNLLSEEDVMGKSLQSVIDNLNAMFREVSTSADQVSTGAKQVADGAQSLAQGSTEQAASIQELSSTIAEIAHKTKSNAETAGMAAKLSNTIKENAEKGNRQMGEMIAAVKDINEASQSISKIIKTIDDIAFQTNILALNAAVEAARAGQHGKGFAVVAEEVRNLASKSAEAARDTGEMIQNTMEKAGLGSRIAGETALSLTEIVAGINESSRLIDEIARASEEQTSGIAQVNIGIDQVAQVVQQNSATAEESAASSEEMSGQANMLQELIARFKVRERGGEKRQSLFPVYQPLAVGFHSDEIYREDNDWSGKY